MISCGQVPLPVRTWQRTGLQAEPERRAVRALRPLMFYPVRRTWGGGPRARSRQWERCARSDEKRTAGDLVVSSGPFSVARFSCSGDLAIATGASHAISDRCSPRATLHARRSARRPRAQAVQQLLAVRLELSSSLCSFEATDCWQRSCELRACLVVSNPPVVYIPTLSDTHTNQLENKPDLICSTPTPILPTHQAPQVQTSRHRASGVCHQLPVPRLPFTTQRWFTLSLSPSALSSRATASTRETTSARHCSRSSRRNSRTSLSACVQSSRGCGEGRSSRSCGSSIASRRRGTRRRRPGPESARRAAASRTP